MYIPGVLESMKYFPEASKWAREYSVTNFGNFFSNKCRLSFEHLVFFNAIGMDCTCCCVHAIEEMNIECDSGGVSVELRHEISYCNAGTFRVNELLLEHECENCSRDSSSSTSFSCPNYGENFNIVKVVLNDRATGDCCKQGRLE